MTTRKVYVMVKGQGEYSDRSEEPYRVYLSEERAKAAMTAAERISDSVVNDFSGMGMMTYEERREKYLVAKKAALAEYEKLGFTGLDEDGLDGDEDWALHEVELVE